MCPKGSGDFGMVEYIDLNFTGRRYCCDRGKKILVLRRDLSLL